MKYNGVQMAKEHIILAEDVIKTCSFSEGEITSKNTLLVVYVDNLHTFHSLEFARSLYGRKRC